MKNRYAIYILTCVMTVILPSCAVVDPAYKQLETQVDTNPSPNAILGAWRGECDWYGEKHTFNFLFQKGGRGVKYANRIGGDGDENEIVEKFTWQHAGNGVWTSDDMMPEWSRHNRLRITKGGSRMLWEGGSGQFVLTHQ